MLQLVECIESLKSEVKKKMTSATTTSTHQSHFEKLLVIFLRKSFTREKSFAEFLTLEKFYLAKRKQIVLLHS
jgi:hypothetical protein